MIKSSVIRIIVIVTLLAIRVRVTAAQVPEVPLDPGLQGASDAGLLPMLNLTQTVDGATVILNYAYADSNRIAYQLSVEADESQGILYSLGTDTLSDDAGHIFKIMFGGGGGGGGSGGGGSGENSGSTRQYYEESSLDASVITGTPDTLNLRLETSLTESSIGGGYGDGIGASATEEPPTPTESAPHPVVFNFTIPFIHGQALETRQSSRANGLTLRLDRLVIAPSLTRGRLCVDPPPTKSYAPSIHLTVDSQPIPFDPLQSLGTLMDGSPAGCYDLQINQSLDQLPGKWTLSIDSLVELLPLWTSVGMDGTNYDYRINGSADDLAQVLPTLEAGLKALGINVTESDGSLKLSFPANSDAVLNAVNAIVNPILRPETPGAWVFRFDVPAPQ